MTVQWSRDWPTEAGWWWFWGQCGSTMTDRPELCQAFSIDPFSDGRKLVCDEQGRRIVAEPPNRQWWARAELPERPGDWEEGDSTND